MSDTEQAFKLFESLDQRFLYPDLSPPFLWSAFWLEKTLNFPILLNYCKLHYFLDKRISLSSIMYVSACFKCEKNIYIFLLSERLIVLKSIFI